MILGALERGRSVLLYPVRVLTKSTWFQSYMGGPPTFFRVILHRGAPGGAEKAKNKLFFEKLSNFLYTNGLCNHFQDHLGYPNLFNKDQDRAGSSHFFPEFESSRVITAFESELSSSHEGGLEFHVILRHIHIKPLIF